MSTSVIIPTYNHASTLASCLDLVFAQTLLPTEVIVVNDGSTDNTDEVIKPFLDRVQYIKQENKGGNAARNTGFERSTGEYVIFLDADAIMEADMLKKLLGALQSEPNAAYAYSKFVFEGKKFPSQTFDANKLKQMNYIHTSALICRKAFPGFDPAIKKFQDWDLWLTMLEAGSFGIFVDEYLSSIQKASGRTGISSWLPSFVYKIPWPILNWTPKTIARYREAEVIIRDKHNL
jgi:glycosyltransferase involved in cell wall biosynthesis